ncbi:hypothetical protein [Nocardioides sp. T2.26MG-1]|uniref:hypothetical protein n=1 Tax=Nocardioides sp. T2.26MG-1 TaxID=3041166 RepID=UPI002477BD44|nr:hypothetical protein [Nocardioides sp. T2.26MG-1]CAI9419329.1 hypothetical protein HIDPHFAB_03638 [Nocardioides sp. T2.26MG-1]
MSNLTARQIMLLLGCALALLTAGVSIYGLVRGPGGTTSDSSAASRTQVEAGADPADPVVTLGDRSLPHTTDPISYAQAVAVSLFDWDTTAGFLPTDYTAAVLGDADPSGEETPGLIDDAAAYLPTVEQWLDLGAMEVVQTIEIDDAYVPDSWSAAVEQAHGHLRPGTTAVTITGTRQRRGVWNGELVESSYPVSFTVFVACPPSFERCHVLRISQLDNPLR